jgi:hypothetical protein
MSQRDCLGGLPGLPLGSVLLLITSHDQRRENGLIEDEEDQHDEPRNHGSCKQEHHAGRHEERPEPEVETHPKR